MPGAGRPPPLPVLLSVNALLPAEALTRHAIATLSPQVVPAGNRLGNSQAVVDAHYDKPTVVHPDIRRAANASFSGLFNG